MAAVISEQSSVKSQAADKIRKATAENFHDAILKAREYNKNTSQWRGYCLHVYSIEEYKEMTPFLLGNAIAGFALKNKDIVSVFKHPTHRIPVTARLMKKAVRHGGDRLDYYRNDYLTRLYVECGFVPVSKVQFEKDKASQDWMDSYGTPDIIFMVYKKLIHEKIQRGDVNKNDQIQLAKDKIEKIPYSSYDEAVLIQEKKAANFAKKRLEMIECIS